MVLSRPLYFSQKTGLSRPVFGQCYLRRNPGAGNDMPIDLISTPRSLVNGCCLSTDDVPFWESSPPAASPPSFGRAGLLVSPLR